MRENLQKNWIEYYKEKRLDCIVNKKEMDFIFLEQSIPRINEELEIELKAGDQKIWTENYEWVRKNVVLSDEMEKFILEFFDEELKKRILKQIAKRKENERFKEEWLNEREIKKEKIIIQSKSRILQTAYKANTKFKIDVLSALRSAKKGFERAIRDFDVKKDVSFEVYSKHVMENTIVAKILQSKYTRAEKGSKK